MLRREGLKENCISEEVFKKKSGAWQEDKRQQAYVEIRDSRGIQGKALDSQEVEQAGQGVCVIFVFESLGTQLDKSLSWV